MTTRRELLLLSVTAFLAFCAPVDGQPPPRPVDSSEPPAPRNICDTCACSPDNRAPLTVNCTCAKAKLLIIRSDDRVVSLSNVRDLTLSSCGYVSFPANSGGLPGLTALALRDMQFFHYTLGMFPALESLTAENIGELVLDGFGPAKRTLRYLTLRRTNVSRLVSGTVTAGMPLRRVLFDNVTVDAIESGALDVAFAGHTDDGGALREASDGFTVVNSVLKSVQTDGISVRSGAMRILNSTLDHLASGAITADNVALLSGNRFDAMVGDSLSVTTAPVGGTSDGGDAVVYVVGNRFRTLPEDLQLFRSERPVEFRVNSVENVDLAPFLFGVGPAVNVTDNQFACDCDPRRISVLKLNQVFPGLLPETDDRLSQLLASNYCSEPDANTTLAGYRDLLVKGIACKGANITAASSPSPAVTLPATDTTNGCNTATTVTAFMVIAAASLPHLVPVSD